MAGLIDITVDGSSNPDLAAAFQGRLEEVKEEQVKAVAAAHTGAAKALAGRYKARLRADIAGGGFANGDRLSKTWQANTYPAGKPALDPAIWIKSNAGDILEAFALGVTITVRNAEFLAIPQGQAKAIVRRLNQASNRSRGAFGQFVDEAGVVQRVAAALGVHLVPIIDRATGHGVLVAESPVRLTPTGRRAKHQTGENTVLFVLVKSATLKKRIRGAAILEDFKASFLADFVAEVASRLGSEAA